MQNNTRDLLRKLFEKLYTQPRKAKHSIVYEFIKSEPLPKYAKRYLYYTLYLHNKDKRAIKYRNSTNFLKDYQQIALDCYSNSYCIVCGKPIIPSDDLLNHAQSLKSFCKQRTVCSQKCGAINGFKAATEKNKSMPKEKKLAIAKKAQETMLKKYGCKSPLCANSIFQDKIKNTLLKKYGVEKNVMQNKEVSARAAATLRKHMMQDNFRQNVNAKREKTSLARYGTKNPSQSSIIKQKIINSNENRSLEEKRKTREKTMKTSLARYGTKHATQSAVIKQRIKEGIAKSRKNRKDLNIKFKECKTKIVSIAKKEYEVQSINEQKFAEWLIYQKNYSPNDLIGQYESEYNDFIYNSIKTFPDFWIKSKNIYIEVKSVFTFFNMYKTYGKIEENALQYNRKKAELANQNGYITRWVICDKSINGNWRFLLLPQSWWTLPLDSLIQLVAAKNFIYLKNIRV